MRIALVLLAACAVLWLALQQGWLPPMPGTGEMADSQASAPTREAAPAAPTIEAARGDLRDVTPRDGVHIPPAQGPLVRLPAVEPPPPPQRRKPPAPLQRPQVKAAGILVADGREIDIAGVEPLPADGQCAGPAGDWPCGAFARTAMQRLIRQRAVACDKDGSAAAEPTRRDSARCSVGGRDIGEWLVRQGWARASDPSYGAAQAEARAERRGQWGNGPGGNGPAGDGPEGDTGSAQRAGELSSPPGPTIPLPAPGQ